MYASFCFVSLLIASLGIQMFVVQYYQKIACFNYVNMLGMNWCCLMCCVYLAVENASSAVANFYFLTEY